jgi:predicted Zn finger-like uncharacterized protein
VVPANIRTRCTACDTVFRVLPEQLNAQAGLVQCNACSEVFNAAWNLIDEVSNPAHGPEDSADLAFRSGTRPAQGAAFGARHVNNANESATGRHANAQQRVRAQLSDSVAGQPTVTATADASLWAKGGTLPTDGWRNEPRLGLPDSATAPPALDAPLVAAADRQRALRGHLGRSLPWLFGSILAGLTLVAQARFVLLDELAAIPAARSYLPVFCRYTGCEIPEKLTGPAFVVTHTRVDLHPRQPDALVVRIQLLNRGHTARPCPSLRLTLSDRAGGMVGRRTYSAAELGFDEGAEPIAGRAITVITLILANPGPAATGFAAQVASI